MAELEEIADELYALPLEEFTATRDARAKEVRADGERTLATAVRGLRRPSTAAWVVNQLVRARRDEVEQVLELGAALREAQASFAGDELRALGKQQHQLVTAVRRTAQKVARERGQRTSETVAREVEATLKAAMADPDAAAAVRSGLLLRALENTGFTSVDLDGAVALPAVLPAHGGRPQLRVVRDDEGTAKDADDAAEAAGRSAERAPRRKGKAMAPAAARGADDERGAADEHAVADEHGADDEQRQADERRAAEERRADEQRAAEERREAEERRAAEERAAARRRAEEAAERAADERVREEASLEEAERAVEDLLARRAELREQVDGLREQIDELRRRLDEVEREDEDASDQLRRARSARDEAEAAVRRATRAEEDARTRLAELPDA